MKRHFRKVPVMATTAHARAAALEKTVRVYIFNIFKDITSTPTQLFNDPELLANVVLRKYIQQYNRGTTKLSWPEYVYDLRHTLFDDAVLYDIDNAVRVGRYDAVPRNEEEKQIMRDYYFNLTPTDYNRMLYLQRDWNDLKSGRPVSNMLLSGQEYTPTSLKDWLNNRQNT